jgi:hypothetical protein
LRKLTRCEDAVEGAVSVEIGDAVLRQHYLIGGISIRIQARDCDRHRLSLR